MSQHSQSGRISSIHCSGLSAAVAQRRNLTAYVLPVLLLAGCGSLRVEQHPALAFGVAAVEFHAARGVWPASQQQLLALSCGPGGALDLATRAAAAGASTAGACAMRFGAGVQQVTLRRRHNDLLLDVRNLASGKRCALTARAATNAYSAEPVTVGRVTTNVFRCRSINLVGHGG
ncbi:MAG: hypothetical protein KDI32_05145 [Pseudomonadales bacterium]|nr:hypothetical protein [Pseudomonadales bacterium]